MFAINNRRIRVNKKKSFAVNSKSSTGIPEKCFSDEEKAAFKDAFDLFDKDKGTQYI
jgi:hypothetical protein